MIGRNDVTGTRDVKITQFPRSPWRSAVASSKTWKSERRQTPARVDRFLFLSFYFFLEVSVSFSCLTPVFICKCNTDVLMTAYKRCLQICFRGGSAAGEQQVPSSSSMADAEEREEKEKNKRKCMFRERERERERERGRGRGTKRERENERERERERERDRERERERERETKQTKARCSC